MICPKCKKEIDDSSIKCPYCSIRVSVKCHNCKSLNPLGSKVCSHCNSDLVKVCSNCECINILSAKICSQCKQPLKDREEEKKSLKVDSEKTFKKVYDHLGNYYDDSKGSKEYREESISEDVENSYDFIDVSHFKLSEFIEQKCIKDKVKYVGLCGQNGVGKTFCLENNLAKDPLFKNYKFMYGLCTKNTQISPFGLINDILSNFLNISKFVKNDELSIRSIKNRIRKVMPFLRDREKKLVLDFLYPSTKGQFKDILFNRDRIFSLLFKIFGKLLTQQSPVFLIIDDLEFIDGSSYEFLLKLIEKKLYSIDNRLLVTYQEKKSLHLYLKSEEILNSGVVNINLRGAQSDFESNVIFLSLTNGVNIFPKSLKRKIINSSRNDILYMDQILLSLSELNVLYESNNVLKSDYDTEKVYIPSVLKEVLTLRLNYLKENYKLVYKALSLCCLMGNSISKSVLKEALMLENKDFDEIILFLESRKYIKNKSFNETDLSFVNPNIQQLVLLYLKENDELSAISKEMEDVLSKYLSANYATNVFCVQNTLSKNESFKKWWELSQFSSYLGDKDCFIISLLQCLKIIKLIQPPDKNSIIDMIEQSLGKLLYEKKPQEAVVYLSNALISAKNEQNDAKVIDLSGYLVRSFSLLSNYTALVDVVDITLDCIDENQFELEYALIKSKKLSALIQLGNFEQVVTIAKYEILNVFEKYLCRKESLRIRKTDLIKANIAVQLNLCLALALQGNDSLFDFKSELLEDIEQYGKDIDYYVNRLKIAESILYLLKGNFEKVRDIIDQILENFVAKSDKEKQIISYCNLILIISKLMQLDNSNIKNCLFEFAKYANNCEDYFSKNMFKVVLSGVLQLEGKYNEALSIINEQLTYFCQERLTLGALICWFQMSQISLKLDGLDKSLGILEKALSVCKNPKVNDYFFISLFKTFIAQIYISKFDFDKASVLLEKALLISRKFNLHYLQMFIFKSFARLFEQKVVKDDPDKENIAIQALTLYDKAKKQAQKLNLEYFVNIIQKEIDSFQAYLQAVNINKKDGDVFDND